MSGFRPTDPGDLLRERGLRSTPQRRAILGVFRGGSTEHLSADEVHAHASQALPDLSRGTVYATLAEFAETGLIAAFGTSEPVRYETNTSRHAHFRCRLCRRLFDLDGVLPEPAEVVAPGFAVERVETRVEGVCADCADYEDGLVAGAAAIERRGPAVEALSVPGVAVAELDGGALGPLLLAATPAGVVRLAFEHHGDVAALRARARRRHGSEAAHARLTEASEAVARYLAGAPGAIEAPLDWDVLGAASDPDGLVRCAAIPYGASRSYSELGSGRPARALGEAFGANPVPLLTPCHRVTRGSELPRPFVGGEERRRWLLAHEREHAQR